MVGHVTPSSDLIMGQAWRQKSIPESHSRRADPVSPMVKEHPRSMRNRAVGMVNGGVTQVQVAKQLKIGPRTLKHWMALECRGDTPENHKGRGRKTAMTRAAKIVVAKSVLKRHQSTRALARKLTGKQHPVSKSAMHRYLRHCLQLNPLQLRRQPRLTASQ